MYLSKPVQYTTPRINLNVNNGLWVIIMCQCRFLDCNKCVTLVVEVEGGQDSGCVGEGGIWEFILFCSVLL